MNALALVHWLAPIAVLTPLAAFVALALLRIAAVRLTERQLARVVQLVFWVGVVSAVGLAGSMAVAGKASVLVSLGTWFSAGQRAFGLTLLIDWLSLPFLMMSALLCGTVGAFTTRYLHREPGNQRFAALLLLFAGGIQLVTTAGSLEVAYIGWELVGLTSALLIAFFHEREAPVHHGLWAYGTYRTSDVALLLAAMLAHVSTGTAEYTVIYGAGPWPAGSPALSGATATAIALLLVFAAMGKSAQVPLSGWLPRAMEGPTPSSAIFYGALSVHAGCYVLLRAGPLLDAQPLARGALVVVGLLTAVYATVVGRAQTDIKTALAYATLTQLGLIFAEIGAGLRTVALLHIIGHAFLRSLQFLRSPSLLHERHQVEAAMGEHVTRTGAHLERLTPQRFRLWLYRFALNRGYLDGILLGRLVSPASRALAACDRFERKLVAWIGGTPRSGERS
jgi:NAD(P)H-quinone oxidoreductase subunit 5